MKILKLKNSDFKNITNAYKRFGAIKGNQTYPQHTYVSVKTYEKLRKTVYAEYKKEYPDASKNMIAYGAELDLLNFSPCKLKGLPDNVMLVDDVAIEAEKSK